MILYLDLETYSSVDLARCGVYRYSEDVEILLFAYALDNEPVKVWDCTTDKNIPLDLREHLLNTDVELCAHNSGFDRIVLETKMRTYIEHHPWRDTMVRALQHGLPGALKSLCEIYQLPEDKAKDKDGRRLIHLFCKPKNDGGRNTAKTHPQEWKKFIEYATLDIVAMREIDNRLPKWNNEYDLWRLDQKINDRGFLVDLDLAKSAIKVMSEHKEKTDKLTQEQTDGAVNSATQRDALLKHILEEHGIDLPNMQQSTLERRLNDNDLPQAVRDLISLRLASSGTATKKYTTIFHACGTDGRMRGTLQFCGAARTGRGCVAKDSKVLIKDVCGTIREKNIQDVDIDDMVFDGENWVRHEGVVFSGWKEIINHDNILATPEHKVYISSTEYTTLLTAKQKGLKLWKGKKSIKFIR